MYTVRSYFSGIIDDDTEYMIILPVPRPSEDYCRTQGSDNKWMALLAKEISQTSYGNDRRIVVGKGPHKWTGKSKPTSFLYFIT